MKFCVWAIVDKPGREPYRPSFYCAVQPQVVENNVVKTPERNVVVEWTKGPQSSAISNVVRDDDKFYKTILTAMNNIYSKKIGPHGQKILGPFEAESQDAAVKAAMAACLDNRELSTDEKLVKLEAEKKAVLDELAVLKSKLSSTN